MFLAFILTFDLFFSIFLGLLITIQYSNPAYGLIGCIFWLIITLPMICFKPLREAAKTKSLKLLEEANDELTENEKNEINEKISQHLYLGSIELLESIKIKQQKRK